MHEPLVIEANPPGLRERLSRTLRGRRLLLSALLALVQVVALIAWRPNMLLAALGALVLLAGAVWVATRLRPGVLRDIAWIVAIAQGIVVLIPMLVGFSVMMALMVGLLLIVALVLAAVRWRV